MSMRVNERGASAVEFALVLPILLLIIAGIINYGVVFAQNIALNNAAREAARFGAVMGDPDAPTDCAAVSTRAETDFETIAEDLVDLDPPAVTVGGAGCSGAPCEGSSENASVRVEYAGTSEFLVPWVLVPGLPDSVNIEGVGEFKCEWS